MSRCPLFLFYSLTQYLSSITLNGFMFDIWSQHFLLSKHKIYYHYSSTKKGCSLSAALAAAWSRFAGAGKSSITSYMARTRRPVTVSSKPVSDKRIFQRLMDELASFSRGTVCKNIYKILAELIVFSCNQRAANTARS